MDIPFATKFVGYKVSSVHWLPGKFRGKRTLVSSSWDARSNKIDFWTVDGNNRNVSELDVVYSLNVDSSVTCLASSPSRTGDQLCLAHNNGKIATYTVDRGDENFSVRRNEDSDHDVHNGLPCTSVRFHNQSIASTGEDGRVFLMALDSKKPLFSGGEFNGPSLNDCCFYSQSEVVTVNSVAQIQMWDTRDKNSDKLCLRCDIGEDTLPSLHSVTVNDRKIIAGDNAGVVHVWDVRKANMAMYPESLLQPHSAEIWALKCHPTKKNNLFTASEDGMLLHISTENSGEFTISSDPEKVNIVDLIDDKFCLGINGLDVEEDWVACGSDSETLSVFALNV
eukprot:m.337899 g.337899  ORF g.337899 m.337899 type:complete len:337 (+) comp18263_c0_seq1:161-1171(+)